ncbi:hypothetical protein GF412_03670 [Candidatus Micrarchaeota archaeon]|nr:hypothetical protein [Candidatus Micrarchaeota archaeon]MBD3418048.1 hypothetical protein [Candidatus Micrarchaeota archaeon]
MRWVLAILGIVLLFAAGCTTERDVGNVHALVPGSEDNPNYETVVFGGVEQQYNVSSNKSVILVVSGSYNVVYVDENTELSEVVMSGNGNLVYISSKHHPKMMRSGMQNLILRYN